MHRDCWGSKVSRYRNPDIYDSFINLTVQEIFVCIGSLKLLVSRHKIACIIHAVPALSANFAKKKRVSNPKATGNLILNPILTRRRYEVIVYQVALIN